MQPPPPTHRGTAALSSMVMPERKVYEIVFSAREDVQEQEL